MSDDKNRSRKVSKCSESQTEQTTVVGRFPNKNRKKLFRKRRVPTSTSANSVVLPNRMTSSSIGSQSDLNFDSFSEDLDNLESSTKWDNVSEFGYGDKTTNDVEFKSKFSTAEPSKDPQRLRSYFSQRSPKTVAEASECVNDQEINVMFCSEYLREPHKSSFSKTSFLDYLFTEADSKQTRTVCTEDVPSTRVRRKTTNVEANSKLKAIRKPRLTQGSLAKSSRQGRSQLVKRSSRTLRDMQLVSGVFKDGPSGPNEEMKEKKVAFDKPAETFHLRKQKSGKSFRRLRKVAGKVKKTVTFKPTHSSKKVNKKPEWANIKLRKVHGIKRSLLWNVEEYKVGEKIVEDPEALL